MYTGKFKVGDKVKVLVDTDPMNPFEFLKVGTVVLISGVWPDDEFPYEIDGYAEQLKECEIEFTDEEVTPFEE